MTGAVKAEVENKSGAFVKLGGLCTNGADAPLDVRISPEDLIAAFQGTPPTMEA
jgi:hypothetical protein